MSAPTVRASLAAGWRATSASWWLAPVGMLVALARGGLAVPAGAFLAAIAAKGALAGLVRGGVRPEAALAGALGALLTPRFAASALGLWLGGVLLSAALRIAYLAGALPTLGAVLSGAPRAPPAFARGVAYGFPRLVGTGILVLLMELAGSGFAATVLLGTVLAAVHAPRQSAPALAAAVLAAALTLAILVPLALSTLGDAALARSALRGESPGRAVGAAARRFLLRPAAFLLAALMLGAVGLAVTGSARAAANLALGFARGAPDGLLLGPQLMIAALAALLGAAVELWRLGAIATLACHEE